MAAGQLCELFAQSPCADRSVCGEMVQHRGRRRGEPRLAVGGDAGLLRIGDESPVFGVGDPVAGRRLDQGEIPCGHHPQRPSHRQVFEHGAVPIHGGIEVVDREAGRARPQRQVRGGRVGGVQPDEAGRYAGHRRRGRTEEVPPRQARAALFVGE